MTVRASSGNVNEFRQPIDLANVRGQRLVLVRHRLGSFLREGASSTAALALWRFAVERPQMYFDPKAATAVLATLEGYAAQDEMRLAELLEEFRPQLDLAFHHLGAINKEPDDGTAPDHDSALAGLVDERFTHKHLQLLEYVLDFLTLPIVAFHCEKRPRKAIPASQILKRVKTSKRFEDQLPDTPARYLAGFWNRTIRNGLAHGSVSPTESGLRIEDSSGNSEELVYREFIRRTDRLHDACNGAALGYIAFLFQHPAPASGPWPLPISAARMGLGGLLDQPDFRLAHIVPQVRAGNKTLLNLHFDHQLIDQGAMRIKAYRAAFEAMDVLPAFDFYGGVLHSPEVILSFVLLSRDDMVAYDTGEIDLAEFCRRCLAHGEVLWDTQIGFAKLKHKWRLYRNIAAAQWEEFKARRIAEEWSEGRVRFELFRVNDCSTDTVKKRTAAVVADTLLGKAKQLQFPDLAGEVVKAADRHRVELPPTARKAANRRGRCDRMWVQVFSRHIRPRDTDGHGFADPYLLTVEYSASGDFQNVKYVGHDVHEFEKYRVSIKQAGR